MLSYSLIDAKSFQNIEKWTAQIEENAPKECCKVLVATKLDCVGERAVSQREGEVLAVKMGVQYI